MITLGLDEILVGAAAPTGKMPTASTMKKIGKVYKDTARITQDASDATEHFEEGKAAPALRKKSKKIPRVEFAIMDPDIDVLVAYIGGTKVEKSSGEKTKWAFDGDEVVEPKSFLIKSQQGLYFEIPNGDIEATIDDDMSERGIFLVRFVVTPQLVTSGKAIRSYDPKEA